MHYYQHHIGDFIKDTANLNDHQIATYMRMVWAYYDSEKPIADELEDIAFAMRSDEKTVRLLLRHYFKASPDGWTHSRCDREIAEYRGKSEKAKLGAAARWTNKNIPKNATEAKVDANALRTHCDGNADANVSHANQEPITNNQEPRTNTNTKEKYTEAFEEVWLAYPQRPGRNKESAFKAWAARLKAGDTAEVMLDGTHRYAAFCIASKREPQYIRQPATFFGPNRHFADDQGSIFIGGSKMPPSQNLLPPNSPRIPMADDPDNCPAWMRDREPVHV